MKKHTTARTQPATCNLQPATVALLAVLLISATGCSGPRPLRGGHATTTGPVTQSVSQGENPTAPTRQDQETIKVRTYTLPAGTRLDQSPNPNPNPYLNPPDSLPIPSHSSSSSHPTINPSPATPAFVLSAPMPVVEREETRAKTELGAAQKDTARELAAKLSSLKGIVWVGIALFIFGLASLFWPPLKAIIGSVTTSIAITLGGLALMVLPTLIVGNELLILGGVVVSVALWFFAHRHGQLRGQLASAAVPLARPTGEGSGVRAPQQSNNPSIQ